MAKPRKILHTVGQDRFQWKLKHLGPSRFQQQMLEYLKSRKAIPFHESVGLNWSMLGGLLARGIATWDSRKDGQWLVLK